MKLLKHIRSLLWRLYYKIFPVKHLEEVVKHYDRTTSPYWKFKPFVYHNKDGKFWEILFKDTDYYASTEKIDCVVYREDETLRIVGIKIKDKNEV
jgi:hypothetical protein